MNLTGITTRATRSTVGAILPIDNTFTAAMFVGIVGSAVKSAFSYVDQGEAGGQYAPKEPTTVVQRGSISVICGTGSPVVGGAVYVRTVENGDKRIGDLEATADTGNNVLLTNAQWGSGADTNKVAELVLLTRNRA